MTGRFSAAQFPQCAWCRQDRTIFFKHPLSIPLTTCAHDSTNLLVGATERRCTVFAKAPCLWARDRNTNLSSCTLPNGRTNVSSHTLHLTLFKFVEQFLMLLLDLRVCGLADSHLLQNCTPGSPPRVLCNFLPFRFFPQLLELCQSETNCTSSTTTSSKNPRTASRHSWSYFGICRVQSFNTRNLSDYCLTVCHLTKRGSLQHSLHAGSVVRRWTAFLPST